MPSLAWKKSSGLLAARVRRSAAWRRSVAVLTPAGNEFVVAGLGETLVFSATGEPLTDRGRFAMVSREVSPRSAKPRSEHAKY